MPSPTAASQAAGVSGRVLAMLVALAGVLVAAFVVAPRTLAASRSNGGFVDRRNFVESVRVAFVEYWNSGARDLTPGMERVVDYWFRYHVAKAVIAGLLLIVLIALGVLLWKAFLRASALGVARRVVQAAAGALVTMLGLFSLATVMANIQGAVAPVASLLPMLTVGGSTGELAETLHQVRQGLADSHGTGNQTMPALEVMISDYARFHVALAVLAAGVAVVLICLNVMLWKKFAGTDSTDRRTRRVWGTFGVLSVLSSLLVIIVAVANANTAANPASGLLVFFEGGW